MSAGTTRLVIVGAGRFALEVLTYLMDLPAYPSALEIVGVLDDGPRPLRTGDFPIELKDLGTIAEWTPTGDQRHVIAVGDPATRWKIAKRLEAKGAQFYTLVHPTAYVAATAVLEPGSIIAPMAIVGPLARVGANAMMNVHSAMGHDADLGEASVLGPSAKMNGCSTVGRGCFLASLTGISPGSKLGDFSKISAGSFLTTDAPEGSLVVGNPARSRVMFKAPI